MGTVAGVIVDPAARRVVALRLANTPNRGEVLHWEDLGSFGADAVTVADPAVVTGPRGRAAELTGKRAEMLDKRVLDDAGDEIGTLTDIDFDPSAGTVTALVTTAGRVEGERLIGCGSYAVVVTAD